MGSTKFRGQVRVSNHDTSMSENLLGLSFIQLSSHVLYICAEYHKTMTRESCNIFIWAIYIESDVTFVLKF
jgi:hypothetical protein